ncbi:MAG: hypothetical protein HYW50_04670 [Candidatus Diapherotrites archaeon]|nr:hypothetical protein [Candidatus Diapherotrites archaeon]
MNKWLDLIEKLGLVLLTLGIVMFILLSTKLWASEQQIWFLRAGDYQSVIFISIGLFAFGWALKKLLVWEIHSALGPHRRHKK